VTYLLDANACIGWIRNNQPKLIARIKAAGAANVFTCSVVIGELVYGVERSPPSHRAANQSRLDQLRAQFGSVPYADDAAVECGRIRAHLIAIGQIIGPNDLQIAAIGRFHGMTVVTHNTAEFGRVPGLLVEDWQ
jgi:tRNA(fMet)-specific endonuclease VapC